MPQRRSPNVCDRLGLPSQLNMIEIRDTTRNASKTNHGSRMHFLHMSDAAGNVMIAARLGSFCASGPGTEGAAPSWRPGLSVAENDYQIGCVGSLREEDAKKILSNLGIAENPRSLRLTGLGLGAWKMGSASGNNVARFRSASTDILSSHELYAARMSLGKEPKDCRDGSKGSSPR